MEGAQRPDTIERAVLLYPTVAISRLTVARLWRVHSASRLCTTVQSALRRSTTTTIRAPAAVAACVLAAMTPSATIPTLPGAQAPSGTGAEVALCHACGQHLGDATTRCCGRCVVDRGTSAGQTCVRQVV